MTRQAINNTVSVAINVANFQKCVIQNHKRNCRGLTLRKVCGKIRKARITTIAKPMTVHDVKCDEANDEDTKGDDVWQVLGHVHWAMYSSLSS